MCIVVVANPGTGMGRGLGICQVLPARLHGVAPLSPRPARPPPRGGFRFPSVTIRDGRLWLCHPPSPWVFLPFPGAPQAFQSPAQPRGSLGGDPGLKRGRQKVTPLPAQASQELSQRLLSTWLARHPPVLPTHGAGQPRTRRNAAARPFRAVPRRGTAQVNELPSLLDAPANNIPA